MSRFRWFCLLNACLFSLYLPAQSLRGVVSDQADSQALEGVQISLRGTYRGSIADSSGLFEVRDLRPGTYQLVAQLPGYEPETRKILLSPGVETFVVLSLRPRPDWWEEAIVISAQRSETDRWQVSETMSVLSQEQLNRLNPRSSPEALMEVPGVWMQKTNHGGGSAFVRGLTGNQTLLLVDGIRLNNSTYRYGPNQYLNTVDPWYLDRIEVIHGGGSVQYGSDALGGVVHLLTPEPSFSEEGFETQAETRLQAMSANMEQSVRANFQLSSTRIATHLGMSYKDFGDLLAGGDLGVQAPSAYQEIAGDFKSILRIGQQQQLTLAWQGVQQNGVGRYDQVAQRGYERYQFDPQQRQLAYLRWERVGENPWLKELRFTTSVQHSLEGREKIREGSNLLQTETDEVRSLGVSLEHVARPRPNWKMVSGAESYFDQIGSRAFQLHLIDSSRTELRGLYPDGATAWNLAAFQLHNWKVGDWQIEGGLRYNWFQLQAEDEQFGNWQIQPQALVGHAAVSRYWSHHHRIKLGIQSGFRAPNINDLSSFGSFDSGIEVPTRDLKPERSRSFELNYRWQQPRISGEVSLFLTRLQDLITRVPSSYLGEDSLNGEAVFTKANVESAMIGGGEASLRWQIASAWRFQSGLAYTYGQTLADVPQPLRRIPPLHGRSSLSWEQGALWVQLVGKYAAAQRRLSGGDISDHRIADGGTDGWLAIDVRTGYRWQWIEISLGGQNLLNKAYRYHGSGLDAYGRSAWLSLKITPNNRR